MVKKLLRIFKRCKTKKIFNVLIVMKSLIIVVQKGFSLFSFVSQKFLICCENEKTELSTESNFNNKISIGDGFVESEREIQLLKCINHDMRKNIIFLKKIIIYNKKL